MTEIIIELDYSYGVGRLADFRWGKEKSNGICIEGYPKKFLTIPHSQLIHNHDAEVNAP